MSEVKQGVYRFLDTDVFYTAVGDEKCDALVLLHPAFADHRIWRYQLAHYARRYFVIAPDMVGHGKSQIGKQRVTMGDMPDIVRSILEKHGKKRAHIAGVSMGSIAAQGVAYVYPGIVRSVTVAGGYSIHKNNAHIQAAQRKEMGKWIALVVLSMKRFRRYITDVSVRSETGRAVFAQGAELFARSSFRAMMGMNRYIVPVADKVGYPLLAMAGQYDTQLSRDAAKQLAENENGQFVLIEGAGHCANIDAPKKFNAALDAFLAGVQGREEA